MADGHSSAEEVRAMTAAALPEFLDQSLDIDSHEMVPVHLWEEVFGESGKVLAGFDMRVVANAGENTMLLPDEPGDTVEITEESVWTRKGPMAPGAIDPLRRIEVMDMMGIARQLVFPTFAHIGLVLRYNPKAHLHYGYDPAAFDRVDIGNLVIDGYNQWALRTTKVVGDRIRPVAVVLGDTVDEMMRHAEEALNCGIRAVMHTAGMPPANCSPADRALDPYWKMLADADVPVCIHLATEYALLASPNWDLNVPEFATPDQNAGEFPVQPYRGATMTMALDNYVTTMVMGGVFERHPTLRFGAIELTGTSIGPLAERLDLWADVWAPRLGKSLSMKPSEYINRNVRVAPYDWEPIDTYFDRYPQIADTYCFSTDYPHSEGGKHVKHRLYERLAPLGEETVRKFFVENGDLLLPD
jgi:predicted TIM-barrel fold metal-dependent hydrolase